MFLSRIIAFHGIAVDWYLRVYWLLPLSIVDSFAEHRRFFRRAPTTLLLSTMNTWASQSTSFPKWVFSLFQRTLFLFINYKQQTAYQNNRHLPHEPPVFLLTKRHTAPEVLSSHAKIWVYAVGERALIIKKPLPWFTLYKKEHDNRANPIVTFCPTKKPTDPKYLPVLIDSSFLSNRVGGKH